MYTYIYASSDILILIILHIFMFIQVNTINQGHTVCVRVAIN